MEFPIHIETISMELPIECFKGSRVWFSYDVFLYLKDVLVLSSSADRDEMQHYAAFHQGLYCLLKYLFRGFQYTKGKKI